MTSRLNQVWLSIQHTNARYVLSDDYRRPKKTESDFERWELICKKYISSQIKKMRGLSCLQKNSEKMADVLEHVSMSDWARRQADWQGDLGRIDYALECIKNDDLPRLVAVLEKDRAALMSVIKDPKNYTDTELLAFNRLSLPDQSLQFIR